jgi:hypothetical protein
MESEYKIGELKIREMTEYEKGEWDMFQLITSASYGKQRFYLEDNGLVHDREGGQLMTVEKAYYKFLSEWENDI